MSLCRAISLQTIYRYSLLLCRIAITYSNGVVLEGLEIDDDTARRAYLILATIAFADIAIVVPLTDVFFAKFGENCASFCH